MTPKETLAVHVILLVSAVPLIAIASVMAFGRVKRNPYFGFRTPATLSDDRIWNPANRYCGKALLCAVLSHLVVVTLNLAGIVQFHVLETLGFLLLALAVAVAFSMIRVRRIVREIDSLNDPE